MATGSSENTVAVLMSPCFRRTQRPSFRSIAGMMSTTVLYSRIKDASARNWRGVAGRRTGFSRGGTDGKNIIPGHGAGKGAPYTQVAAVSARSRGAGSSCARNRSGWHRGCPARARAAVLPDLVPADVRNLQPRGGREARHPSRSSPRPSASPSSPRSNSICSPMQIPRKGLLRVASSTASRAPLAAS